MRILDKLRLLTDLLQPTQAIRIPMMAGTVDKQLRMIVRAGIVQRIPQRLIVGVVADIKPGVVVAVDMSQADLAYVVASVLVDHIGIRTGRDLVVLAWRESPVTPLLGVCDVEWVGDQ